MKRFLLVALLVLAAMAAQCQTYQIVYRDNFTLAYEPPAVLPVLLPGESMHYSVWLWDVAQGAPVATSTAGWAFVASTPTLEQYVIVPPDPRREYAVGVQVVHVRADSVEIPGYFAVTTNAADIDTAGYPGVPFVYAPASGATPGKARNLRDKGM
jgi:hypothetical protein